MLGYLFVVVFLSVIGAGDDNMAWLIAGIVVFIPLNVWVINEKGRSLWWFLLANLFSPLWLKNKNRE